MTEKIRKQYDKVLMLNEKLSLEVGKLSQTLQKEGYNYNASLVGGEGVIFIPIVDEVETMDEVYRLEDLEETK